MDDTSTNFLVFFVRLTMKEWLCIIIVYTYEMLKNKLADLGLS